MDLPPNISPRRSWLAIGTAFFVNGLCFSSWASRIPTIQQKLGLSETLLGTLLFALPAGTILTSFMSAAVVTRLGIRRMLIVVPIVNGLVYVSIGLVEQPGLLALLLFLIGCLGNLLSVSANTQAVGLEALTKKQVMASLHGLWSTAGFVGAAFGSLMMSLGVSPALHFSFIFLFIIVGVALNAHAFLHNPKTDSTRVRMFVRPPRAVLGLGLIAFCSMICEGAMFDWSGVYFQTILQATAGSVGLGYGSFMAAMASSRFFADRVTLRYGSRRVLTGCGLLVAVGLLCAIIYPSIATGIIGFLLVGMGTSAVVPTVYSNAGRIPGMAPSAAIAATSTIGFVGFLLGPPLIGWIAGASSLRWSFLVIALLGLGIAFMGRWQFKSQPATFSGNSFNIE